MIKISNPNLAFKFPAKNRILKSSDYTDVMKFADKTLYSKTCVCFAKINLLGTPRLGLAIPKKRIKKAVERNRIKRIYREAFRLKKRDFQSFDIVLMSNGITAKMDNKQIFLLVNQLLKGLE